MKKFVQEVVLPEGLPDLNGLVNRLYLARGIKGNKLSMWNGTSVIIPAGFPCGLGNEAVIVGLVMSLVLRARQWKPIPIGDILNDEGMKIIRRCCCEGDLNCATPLIDSIWSLEAKGDISIVECDDVQYIVPQPPLIEWFHRAKRYVWIVDATD